MCGIYAGVKPSWIGPPFVNGAPTQYAYQGVEEYNDFNDRLSWIDNRKILRLNPVFRNDTGLYSCALARVGNWHIRLNVRGKVIDEQVSLIPSEMKMNTCYYHYSIFHITVRPLLPTISDRYSGSDLIYGTGGMPITLTCLSAGGYPQQMVDWYKRGVTLTKLNSCTYLPIYDTTVELFNVTVACTFTPTSVDHLATLFCQSTYDDEPALLQYTDVKFKLACKYKCPCVDLLPISICRLFKISLLFSLIP